MSSANSGFSLRTNNKPEATAIAINVVRKNVFVVFFAMTSIANKIPAIGLQNSAVIPAATPAEINSVLYFLKIISFCCATEPIVAEATTVDTSMPVDPPKITVRKPLMKCDGILYKGRFFDLVWVLSKISLMPLFSFFLREIWRGRFG